MPTVADARKSFTDLLGRAHYADELIPIFRRNTPYATIVSEKAGKFIEKANEIVQNGHYENRDELLEDMNRSTEYKVEREFVERIEKMRISKGLGTWEELLSRVADLESEKPK